MKELKEEHNAPFMLIYGETNSGKTTSIILTAPGPILCITPEGDALKSVAVARKAGIDVDIKAVQPSSHEDLMGTLNKIALKVEKENEAYKYKTIMFDSGTYWMNSKLSIRVEDDRNRDRKGEDQGKLSAMSKTDWTEVNTVNSQMMRLTDLLKTIANNGVMVIMTAQMQEDPKWNRELEAAPCFNYKDYNKALKGYFDFIGFTIPRLDADENVIFPPLLSFSGSRGYLVKWRGVQPKSLTGLFDLSKMFKWYVKRVSGKGEATED